ncbi:Unknown protein [Striga hermonthica]|uniref:Uncharacterized protein n=1 Tax=Striga hermonthica TaxID=68872 RepID=A0A9N7NQ83_STRHE|nr:Unknown protein [Striga hermonthica]
MNNYFPLLKSLSLYGVRLSIESFYFFSLNFPCLECLSFKHCYGFVEFELSHRSVKELEITAEEPLNRVAIDVPSIVMFKYEGCCVPESFSFMTNSKKWKSDITLPPDYFYNENSPRLGKVGQLLRAVSGSEISLDIGEFDLSPQFVPVFMDNIFCICRLRIIQWSHLVRPEYMYMLYETLKHMCMFLGMEMGEFVSVRHWRRQDLEKITFETSDDNEEKWHPIVERSWSEFRDALSVRILRLKHRMRFRLTWRE